MLLRLHDDWKHILLHAWSVRFIGIAAVFSGLEVGLPLIQPYVSINPIYLSTGAGLATAAAFVSRLIAQKEFEEVEHGA
jgi:hypothetical protein